MEENNDSTENPQQGQGRQNAIKCGWLRKQGGFVKTWHTRWFVLKGDQLYYFKDEDETKPLLQGQDQGTAPTQLIWSRLSTADIDPIVWARVYQNGYDDSQGDLRILFAKLASPTEAALVFWFLSTNLKGELLELNPFSSVLTSTLIN
ncbi:hypothetical protein P7K49_006595 [Saguinus oedipus]|uniref:PH domain-containing protein n=1 Tax=Saguinus oedipus TaxID=9490 RepID=A0ABQ9W2W4_SAGOE|nr:hypothetical protein P7K49_006595 [Saguinus oedipus]